MEDQLELLAYTASMPNFRDPQPELPVYTAVDTIPSTTEPQAELPAYTAEANVPSITEPQPVHMTETQPHQFPDSRIEEVQSARTDDNKKPGTESLTEGEGEIETIIQIDENVSSLTDPQPEMPTQAHTAPGSRSGGSRTRTQTQARSPRTNQQRGSRRRQSRTRLRARCTEAWGAPDVGVVVTSSDMLLGGRMDVVTLTADDTVAGDDTDSDTTSTLVDMSTFSDSTSVVDSDEDIDDHEYNPPVPHAHPEPNSDLSDDNTDEDNGPRPPWNCTCRDVAECVDNHGWVVLSHWETDALYGSRVRDYMEEFGYSGSFGSCAVCMEAMHQLDREYFRECALQLLVADEDMNGV